MIEYLLKMIYFYYLLIQIKFQWESLDQELYVLISGTKLLFIYSI